MDFLHTFEEISSVKNLFTAWAEFRLGKRGSADVQDFEYHLEDNIFRLNWELKNKAYVHAPYHRFQIFDPKHRIIHKADVRDRVVHHAIYRVLAPIFEPSFVFDSYSCRIGKGTHAAVDRLEGFARKVSKNYTGPCWALKCDIRKFFDSINHEILQQLIRQKIGDPDTLWLVENIGRSFDVVDNFSKERERVHGIPIGNLTSQLFANVYMNPFDHFVKEVLRVKYYLRYTDDFILVHEDPAALVSLLPPMRAFLKERLALDLHPRKIELRKLNRGIDFLGYVILHKHRILRAKTGQRIVRRIEKDGLSKEQLSSYLGLLSHCEGFETEQQLRRWYLENHSFLNTHIQFTSATLWIKNK